LIQAIRSGKVSEVNDIIRSNHPIKWSVIVKKTGWDALHLACLGGHDAIVVLLLALPGIDVNVKMRTGWTPFSPSVCKGRISCVRVLLKDSRVNVNEPTDSEYTPLWWATFLGHIDIIKWWIASGREVDMGRQGTPGRMPFRGQGTLVRR